MNIGIIGSGNVGKALGETWLKKGHRVLFSCGNDPGAKTIVGGLARDAGFEVVDAGPLAISRLLEPVAMLWIHLAYGQKMGPGFAFALLKR